VDIAGREDHQALVLQRQELNEFLVSKVRADARQVTAPGSPQSRANAEYSLEGASAPAPVNRKTSRRPDCVAVVVLKHEAVSERGRESVDRRLLPRDSAWRAKFAKPDEESRSQAGDPDPNSCSDHSSKLTSRTWRRRPAVERDRADPSRAEVAAEIPLRVARPPPMLNIAWRSRRDALPHARRSQPEVRVAVTAPGHTRAQTAANPERFNASESNRATNSPGTTSARRATAARRKTEEGGKAAAALDLVVPRTRYLHRNPRELPGMVGSLPTLKA
jgi:hypothetical protein